MFSLKINLACSGQSEIRTQWSRICKPHRGLGGADLPPAVRFRLDHQPHWIPIWSVADFIQPPGDPQTAQTVKRAGINSPAGAFFTLRAADVQLYRICDDLSGMLIFPMLVFGPWVFGTTQPWAIWTMNFAGYALGILLLVKIFIRGPKGYTALRWENYSTHSATKTRHRHPLARLLARSLAGLTLAVLAFCLVSALNARATYDPDTRLFDISPLSCLAAAQLGRPSHLVCFLDLSRTGRLVLGGSRLAAGHDPGRGTRRSRRRLKMIPPSHAAAAGPVAAIALAAMHQWRAAGLGKHCPARERFQQIVVSGAAAGESGRRSPIRAVCLSWQCRRLFQFALAGVPWLLVDIATRRRAALQLASSVAVLRRHHGGLSDYFQQPRRRAGGGGHPRHGGDFSGGDKPICICRTIGGSADPPEHGGDAGDFLCPGSGIGLVFRLGFAGAALGTI